MSGTCLTRGCDQSKTPLHRAGVAETIHSHPALSEVVQGAIEAVSE
ncbi:hypothetical protein [Halorussus sp. MSC15.2]|nr:hypothetical protein [Halorussus sp. MSC15.2]NEU58623.1 hypothetical protein [Halorussus sp. MSC15.2]